MDRVHLEPPHGMHQISPGCKNCYAERMAKRLKAMGQEKYAHGFKLTPHPQVVLDPLKWKKPQIIFVNSMSDLFHKDVSVEFIQSVFKVMREAHWHKFQVLTKRAERLTELNPLIEWVDNIWMGVSVENSDYAFRIDHLRNTGAKTKFLSLEPLLGPLPNLNLAGIDWAIVGGESGPKSRTMKEEWVTDIRDQCLASKTPFFFKQWGGTQKKKAGRELQGRKWSQMPRNAQFAGT